MESLQNFEEFFTNLPSNKFSLDDFNIYTLKEPLEVNWGGYASKNSICPTEFKFLLNEQVLKEFTKHADDLEHQQEVSWNEITNYQKYIFRGITDILASPVSGEQSVSFFDFGGKYIIFDNSPDDLGPRLCAYMDRESFYSNVKAVIEIIFLSKGEIIDKSYPFLWNGLWDNNMFYNFFDIDFTMQLIHKTLETNNLWLQEYEELIEFLERRSNGKNSDIDMKIQQLSEVRKSVLGSSTQKGEYKKELLPDEKKLLVENIFQFTVKIYKGNSD